MSELESIKVNLEEFTIEKILVFVEEAKLRVIKNREWLDKLILVLQKSTPPSNTLCGMYARHMVRNIEDMERFCEKYKSILTAGEISLDDLLLLNELFTQIKKIHKGDVSIPRVWEPSSEIMEFIKQSSEII